MAFLRRQGSYKPCNHILNMGIIIFPCIDNIQSTGHNKLQEKNEWKIEKEEEKQNEGPC